MNFCIISMINFTTPWNKLLTFTDDIIIHSLLIMIIISFAFMSLDSIHFVILQRWVKTILSLKQWVSIWLWKTFKLSLHLLLDSAINISDLIVLGSPVSRLIYLMVVF